MLLLVLILNCARLFDFSMIRYKNSVIAEGDFCNFLHYIVMMDHLEHKQQFT